jgi:3-carboxy-cis,cis-muconate cycloisomerase
VQQACDRAIEQRRALVDVLAEDAAVTPHLDRAALVRLTDPASYLGEATDVVDRVVARARERLGVVTSG